MVNQTDEPALSALAHIERELTDDPQPVYTARQVVTDALRRRPHLAPLIDAALLVTSELVTDAVCAHGLVSLRVEVDTDRVEVGVLDDVLVGDAESAPLSGRLPTVGTVASASGVRMLPHQRWRWAVLEVGRRRP